MFARTVSLLALALGCASVPTASRIAPEQAASTSSTTQTDVQERPAPASDTSSAPSPSVTESNAVASPSTDPANAVASPSADAEPEYRTPLLDEVALARAARAACEAAESAGRPLLLEFSASWCEDCLTLERLKTAAPLAREIERWEWFVVNVGGGFEHPQLMRVFRVDAIAKLVVVDPRSCAEPLTAWRQGHARTLDGMAKHEASASAELSAWLGEERRRAARAGSAR